METEIGLVERHGCWVPDINYEPLGGFLKLPFGTEAEILKSLHFLNTVGGKAAPSYGMTLKLAFGECRGHGVQGNPCIVVNYCPYLGLTERDIINALMTIGGNLKYPNTLVNAVVVSHKYYTALVEDQSGFCDEYSAVINEEFHSPDGQVFMALVSVQIAHAFMTFFNKYPIKFHSYDPVANIQADQCVAHPVEAVAGKFTMIDMKSNFRRGCMRQGADILNYPDPDSNDPHWKVNQVTGELTWSSKYILREDWRQDVEVQTTSRFYRSGIQFQKHQNRDVRFLDLQTSRVRSQGISTCHINRTVPYRFVNWSRSSNAAEGRREDRRSNVATARGSSWTT